MKKVSQWFQIRYEGVYEFHISSRFHEKLMKYSYTKEKGTEIQEIIKWFHEFSVTTNL